MGFLIQPHPLTNFEIQKFYKNEPRFNSIFSRNNLPKKIRDGAYVINFDEYALLGTHWIALFCNRNEIPEEIKEFIDRRFLNSSASQNKNMKAKIFRVQANNSVMCRYFCIGFIDFMLGGKKLTDYTNLFFTHNFKKNNDIILSSFKNE